MQSEISSTGRRPNQSESGPMRICSTALTARNSETASPMAPSVVPKCACIAGSEGRKTFIVNAVIEVTMTRVRACGGVVLSAKRTLVL